MVHWTSRWLPRMELRLLTLLRITPGLQQGLAWPLEISG
jgi:hypothetical protein